MYWGSTRSGRCRPAGLGSLWDPQFKARLLGRGRREAGLGSTWASRCPRSKAPRLDSPARRALEQSRPTATPAPASVALGLQGRRASALPALWPAGAGLAEELGHDVRAPAQGDALLAGQLQRHGQA
ncbi:hypothetical protein VULLAG_LOCUS19578 [Vulpes lagopus]